MIGKEALLAKRVETTTLEVPDVGTIEVRQLSRSEALQASKLQDKQGVETAERFVLTCALVDPELTNAEVKDWMANSSFGEINDIVNAVHRFSGIAEDEEQEGASQKEAMIDFPNER